MSTIDELMRVLQFGDSMLPVGSFSFSNGLEPAIETGVVHDVASLKAFVHAALDSAATTDGVGLLHAHRAALPRDFARICQIDQAIFARKLNEEMRTMTVRMGRKLAELSRRVMDSQLISEWLSAIKKAATPGAYPVAQGLVCSLVGLSEQSAFAIHQYGIAGMMLGAAVRLMRIDHLETQAILFQLNATAEQSYRNVMDYELDDMATFAPLWDTLASIHIKSHVRMFMN